MAPIDSWKERRPRGRRCAQYIHRLPGREDPLHRARQCVVARAGSAARREAIAPCTGTVGTVGTVAAVLRITFTPGTDGSQQSTVRFTANDPQRPQTSVSVTGQGVFLLPAP
jgi:hypothetical protein